MSQELEPTSELEKYVSPYLREQEHSLTGEARADVLRRCLIKMAPHMNIDTDNLSGQELIDTALKAIPQFEKLLTPEQRLLTGEQRDSATITANMVVEVKLFMWQKEMMDRGAQLQTDENGEPILDENGNAQVFFPKKHPEYKSLSLIPKD